MRQVADPNSDPVVKGILIVAYGAAGLGLLYEISFLAFLFTLIGLAGLLTAVLAALWAALVIVDYLAGEEAPNLGE